MKAKIFVLLGDCRGDSVDKVGCQCYHGDESRSTEASMIQPVILEKLEELPESLQTEVLHYIEFLIEKQGKNSTQDKPKKRGGIGIWKGKISMSDDFDEPLEDLKDYM